MKLQNDKDRLYIWILPVNATEWSREECQAYMHVDGCYTELIMLVIIHNV